MRKVVGAIVALSVLFALLYTALEVNAFNMRYWENYQARFDITGRTLRVLALAIVLWAWVLGGFTKKTFLFGLYVWDAVILVLGVLIVTNFSRAFILFHKLFFTNDLWLLNPKTDWMIRLLPESFFQGIALRTAISFLVGLILIHVLTIFRKEKKA